MSLRVAVVGNGPVGPGLASAIDAADRVIRFNEPKGAPETVGSRTDLLFAVNSGKSAEARLKEGAFLASPHLAAARRVVLPLHPAVIRAWHPRPHFLSRLKGRRADWTAPMVEALGACGKEVSVLPVRLYDEACRALGIAGENRRKLFPSTGFIALLYALERFPAPAWRVELAGFGFAGWKRHPWAAEQAWVEAAVAAGRLHPLLAGGAASPSGGP